MAIRSDRLEDSHISDQEYFTFLYGHTKHNMHNRGGGRKENKHGLGLALSARREKFVTLLCSSSSICRLSRVCIRAKFLQSHKGMLTPLLTLANLVSQSTGSSSRLSRPSASPDFCRLPSFLDRSVLSTSIDRLLLLTLGHPFPRPVSWEISRPSPLCGFHAKTEKGILTDTHTHRNEGHPSCHRESTSSAEPETLHQRLNTKELAY